MRKWIRRILVIVLSAVFLFSGGTVLVVLHQYRESRESYDSAAAAYTRPGSLVVRDQGDVFLYNSVTKTAKPQETRSGGGSSTHTSSSGASHGGGGGKF